MIGVARASLSESGPFSRGRDLPRHIGIVAVSPEGSAICYRKIARMASHIPDPMKRPLITLHNLPFATYLEAIQADDWQKVGTMLRWSSETLAAAGADFIILPDNIAHFAIQFAEHGSTRPWLSMIDLVARRVKSDGLRTVGIIGTRPVMNGSVYQTALGLQGVTLLAPEENDAGAIDHIIYSELVEGQVLPASRERVVTAIGRLAKRGCQGVILGSTETPLLFEAGAPALPVYDPVDLLVEGAMEMAVR